MNIDLVDDLGIRGRADTTGTLPRPPRCDSFGQGAGTFPKQPASNSDCPASDDSCIGVLSPGVRSRCQVGLRPASAGVAPPKPKEAQLPSASTSRNDDRELLEALTSSSIFAQYRRAFMGATGLSITLEPVHSFVLPDHGRGNGNLFCRLLAQQSRSCGQCLNLQASLKEGAKAGSHTVVCRAGLSETAVPIRVGNRLLGYLQTVPVFRRKPTQRQFERAVRWLRGLHLDFDWDKLREAYFSAAVVGCNKRASVVTLLSIFAQHLSLLGNQLSIQRSNAEPPWVKRAKGLILQNYAEELRLADVAKSVNMSPYHFCKMFKRATALTFTSYLARVRTEHCKNLLHNPNLRVSEIAYEVGFQSVTHFNRVFRRITGQSPTDFRCGRSVNSSSLKGCPAAKSRVLWHDSPLCRGKLAAKTVTRGELGRWGLDSVGVRSKERGAFSG